MKITKLFIAIILLVVLVSCGGGQKPIVYGNDHCDFCKMTIVDKIYGAELVTSKGKVFKFDATECMLNYAVAEKDAVEGCTFLTNYFEKPTELTDATKATFLISKNLPSPMGANLTAFASLEEAEKMQMEMGGEVYSWNALRTHLKK